MQDWLQMNKWSWEDRRGYRIAAARVNGRFRYLAFRPPVHADYAAFREELKESYALGEHVPQYREPLGSFDGPADARAACDADAPEQAA